ncbi:MAG TPA: hypothetical protein VJB56_00945 [Candidatus Paceibacterota bacterium]
MGAQEICAKLSDTIEQISLLLTELQKECPPDHQIVINEFVQRLTCTRDDLKRISFLHPHEMAIFAGRVVEAMGIIEDTTKYINTIQQYLFKQ